MGQRITPTTVQLPIQFRHELHGSAFAADRVTSFSGENFMAPSPLDAGAVGDSCLGMRTRGSEIFKF